MPLSLKKNARKARNSYTRTSSVSGKKGPRTAKLRMPAFLAASFGRIKSLSGLKSLAAIVTLLVGMGLVLAGVCFTSLWLYNTAITSDFFTTRHIDVAGNVRLSRDMVLQYGGRADVADFFGLALARGETLTLRLDARYRVADGRISAIRISARE